MNEEVPAALDGQRIDRVISLITDVSRSAAVAAIEEGDVLLDGTVVDHKSRRVATGQLLTIRAELGSGEGSIAADTTVEVDVCHVDDDVIIVDKRAGQVVHPGAGNDRGTIIQGLLHLYPGIAQVGEPTRPGVVHRLDKGTSGLFAVARTEAAHASLTEQLRERSVERRYLTICWGIPESAEGEIDAPIGRAVRDPRRMTIRDDGKDARTFYEVRTTWEGPGTSLLACRLATGRTHQIRVHLQAIGHPVIGDPTYGGSRASTGIDRPALHAAELGFIHPGTGRPVSFSSEMPADMQALISTFDH